jgi:hypothetical protein
LICEYKEIYVLALIVTCFEMGIKIRRKWPKPYLKKGYLFRHILLYKGRGFFFSFLYGDFRKCSKMFRKRGGGGMEVVGKGE